MDVDSRTTRGERRGIGSLLVKKELNEFEDEVDVEVEPFPLQVEDKTEGFII